MSIMRRQKSGGGVHKDIVPPENTNLAWVDTSVVGIPLVKIFDEDTQEWKATGSTSTAVGQASLISFDATGTTYTSGNVEGALKEADTKLGQKATATDLATHTSNTTVHITGTERTDWNSKAAGNHTHTELHTHSNKIVLDKVSYTGAKSSVDLKGIEDNATAIAGKAPSVHTHDDRYYTETEITNTLTGYAKKDANGKVNADTAPWTGVSGKPTTFPPSTHSHATSEVTGLDSALSSKANQTSLEDLFNTVSQLQSKVSSLETRVQTLEGQASNGPTVAWKYDFIVPASTGEIILTNDPGWTHTLTNEDIYGPALDGVGAKAELRVLGVQDGVPDEPGQILPRDGIDTFAAPSIHGAYTYDASVSQILLGSMAMNAYYFRIVKYV